MYVCIYTVFIGYLASIPFISLVVAEAEEEVVVVVEEAPPR